MPSYNMEKYLNRCIDSFLVPEVLDQLEIIIVNDGSTDGTLSIANDYKARYPQTIVVIDKPNGHYGSCVNASLKVATGKYFRIVDADDWVDSDALAVFIKTLANIDVDCVCTHFSTHDLKDNSVNVTRVQDNLFEKKLDLDSYLLDEDCLHMHTLTFSLDLLQRIEYVQTEGICYTDTEYSYLPLACSKDIYFLNISLYQYFIGREDQSMSPDVLKKNFGHLIEELCMIRLFHTRPYPFNRNEVKIYSVLIGRLTNMATTIYLMYGTFNPKNDFLLKELITELNQISEYRGLYDNTICKVPYVYLWYHSGPLSRFFFSLSHLLRRFH